MPHITTVQGVKKFVHEAESLDQLRILWRPTVEEAEARKGKFFKASNALTVIGRHKAWPEFMEILLERFPEANVSLEKMFFIDNILDCHIPRDILLKKAYQFVIETYEMRMGAFAHEISALEKNFLFTSLVNQYITQYLSHMVMESWTPEKLVEFANTCDHWDIYQRVAGLFVRREKLTGRDLDVLRLSKNSNLSQEAIVSQRIH